MTDASASRKDEDLLIAVLKTNPNIWLRCLENLVTELEIKIKAIAMCIIQFSIEAYDTRS